MIYTKDNPKLVSNYFVFEGSDVFTGVVVDEFKNTAYYLNGQFHKEDGPAVIYSDKFNHKLNWFLNGKRHRIDGPAIEYSDGRKEWWLDHTFYGDGDDFTIESWIRFVKLELLK